MKCECGCEMIYLYDGGYRYWWCPGCGKKEEAPFQEPLLLLPEEESASSESVLESLGRKLYHVHA